MEKGEWEGNCRHKGPMVGVESKQREASETITQVVCDIGDKRPGRTLCQALLDTLRVGFKS